MKNKSGSARQKDGVERPSFFSGLFHGIVRNLPLLAAGAVLLIIGLIFDARILRFISYSLFLAYFLSCSVQALYGISSKSYLRAHEGEDKRKDPAGEDPGGCDRPEK